MSSKRVTLLGDGCVFCAVAQGQAEASIIFEDEWVIAFMDLQPVTPGHLLVIPKSHAEGLEDLQDDIGVQVWRMAHRLGRELRLSGLRCEGVNLFLADGKAAFQEVCHVHLHGFPASRGLRSASRRTGGCTSVVRLTRQQVRSAEESLPWIPFRTDLLTSTGPSKCGT
ncbi:HIT domain-containing protein [Streptomyces sp. NBC_01537]|uniref:HIT family protein n=1 Tax=Streptomyces sp. NBC_01537 TaxID=2903896 RepID=UPI00386825C7